MNQSDALNQSPSGSELQSIEALVFEAPDASGENETGGSTPQSDSWLNSRIAGRVKPNRSSGVRWWHSQFNLMIAVFSLLVIAAGLIVMLAPAPEMSQTIVSGSSSVNSNPILANAEAPWNQNQLAQARSESQAILANLLDRQKLLQQKHVLGWAPDRYQQALDIAGAGDEYYKQGDFEQAIGSYQSAVDQMDSLLNLLPEKIRARLSEAEIAINAGKSALAKDKFEQVLQLDESNISAATGLDRASKLDQVLELLNSANSSEAEYMEGAQLEDLLTAEQKLLQATAFGTRYQAIDKALPRIRSAIVDKRFQIAMSNAYKALFAGRYSAARSAFSEALKIKPGDPSAAAALQQSLASDKTSSLSRMLADAKAYEAREEWASAQSSYQTALQRDPNQLGAKLGSIRTGARKQLDLQIRNVLADTLSFNQAKHKSRANELLVDAKALTNKGSKLIQQIEQLERSLSLSDTAIKITLVSDRMTDVSLQKVGSKVITLGKFSNKNLSLKPGRYLAKGVRLGYHDVLTEIELYPDIQGVRSINILCDQPIKRLASQNNSSG